MNVEIKFKELYRASVAKFEDRWQSGLYERVGQKRPDLLAHVDRVEDRLNGLWIQARAGNLRLKDFKDALTEWEILHFKMLNPLEVG